jgi:predicted alpha/beta superfamily hydrolase
MTKYSRVTILALAIPASFLLCGYSHAQVPTQTSTPPKGVTSEIHLVSERPYSAGSVELVLRSERLARDYTVVVTPPSGGFAAEGRKFPALYVLDGGYGIAGSLGQFLGGAGMMSLAYVVSIGAPDANRLYDFVEMPIEREGAVVGGGAERFRRFLLDELRPYLEARFPIDPGRATLFGHSLGAAFTAGLLSRSPGAFSAYVIGSPALWADPELPTALRKAALKGVSARIYIAVGEKEQSERLEDFERVAKALGGPGSAFTLEKRVFAGETHVSYVPQLVTAAFSWLLPPVRPTISRTGVSVPAEMLDRLVGVYETADGRTIAITRNATQISSQVSTSTIKVPLWAETPTHFFVTGFDYEVTFGGVDSGVATTLVLHQNGVDVNARRRDP